MNSKKLPDCTCAVNAKAAARLCWDSPSPGPLHQFQLFGREWNCPAQIQKIVIIVQLAANCEWLIRARRPSFFSYLLGSSPWSPGPGVRPSHVFSTLFSLFSLLCLLLQENTRKETESYSTRTVFKQHKEVTRIQWTLDVKLFLRPSCLLT